MFRGVESIAFHPRRARVGSNPPAPTKGFSPMNRLADPDLHYIVVDFHRGSPIFVFVGQNPEVIGGPAGEPVTLDLMPSHKRFAGGSWSGLPVLGQHPSGSMLFREFESEALRDQVGFLPVKNYRICDTWL